LHGIGIAANPVRCGPIRTGGWHMLWPETQKKKRQRRLPNVPSFIPISLVGAILILVGAILLVAGYQSAWRAWKARHWHTTGAHVRPTHYHYTTSLSYFRTDYQVNYCVDGNRYFGSFTSDEDGFKRAEFVGRERRNLNSAQAKPGEEGDGEVRGYAPEHDRVVYFNPRNPTSFILDSDVATTTQDRETRTAGLVFMAIGGIVVGLLAPVSYKFGHQKGTDGAVADGSHASKRSARVNKE
jgi:hypothetical protein